MNFWLLAAGILCFVLGVVHSILGEYATFRRKRKTGGLFPTDFGADLKKSHARIIWVSWHLPTLFGWCISAILVKLSFAEQTLTPEFTSFTILSIAVLMFASSILVLIGTKGKHPGWAVLLLIGILLMLGH